MQFDQATHGVDNEWEIGDCLAQWWRPNFETFMVSSRPVDMAICAFSSESITDRPTPK